MIASFLFCLALAAGEFTSENSAAGVQPPPEELQRDHFEPTTIGADAVAERTVLDADDLPTLEARVGTVIAVQGECTAAFVPESGAVVVLNFAEDYRTAITVPIFRDHYDKWPGGAETIKEAYVGKTLLIEGLATSYRDAPQIKVAHPGQLRVVLIARTGESGER